MKCIILMPSGGDVFQHVYKKVGWKGQELFNNLVEKNGMGDSGVGECWTPHFHPHKKDVIYLFLNTTTLVHDVDRYN